MITCRDSGGVSLVRVSQVPELISRQVPFETKGRNLRGFHDYAGNFGVYSYDHLIARFTPEGAPIPTNPPPRPYKPHLALVNSAMKTEVLN